MNSLLNLGRIRNKRKVAIQTAFYHPYVAGAEVFAQKLAEYLVERGHEVDIITWRLDRRLKRHEFINGVNVYRVNIPKIPHLKCFFGILTLAYRTWMLDKQKDYDVVHSHLAFPTGQSGTIVKKLRKKRHLITVQGGDLADYKSETPAKYFGIILKPLISWSLKNADLVHAVSIYTKIRAEELGARETIMIPNGVDVTEFKPMDKGIIRAKYGYSEKDFIIVSVSRLTPKNGIDYLIKAIDRVIDDIPNIRLVVIGDGIQRKKLIQLINNLRLTNKIDLLGNIPHSEIPEYLNIADVFVRPSLEEGFGISFIEAMACKVPVIGSNIGGIPDIIKDAENGYMVVPRNINELVQKLIRLSKDKELRHNLAENGYQTVQEKFNWNVVLKNMYGIYEKLL